jgi:hypothetical protein
MDAGILRSWVISKITQDCVAILTDRQLVKFDSVARVRLKARKCQGNKFMVCR